MGIKHGFVCSIFFSLLVSYGSVTQAALGLLKAFIPHKHEQCAKALPTNQKQFCRSFKEVASCHCTSSGMPKGMCGDMTSLYKRMISIFSTVEQACEHQQDTSRTTCIDSWKCYRLGGKNSKNQLCSSTGHACQ